MPALNFQKQFADQVASGEKTQTIRATRKRPIRRDDNLYLYTGMRTKGCRKLREAKCWGTFPISIYPNGETFVSHRQIIGAKLAEFFRRDGFATHGDGLKWFRETHGLPFHGDLIVWTAVQTGETTNE